MGHATRMRSSRSINASSIKHQASILFVFCIRPTQTFHSPSCVISGAQICCSLTSRITVTGRVLSEVSKNIGLSLPSRLDAFLAQTNQKTGVHLYPLSVHLHSADSSLCVKSTS